MTRFLIAIISFYHSVLSPLLRQLLGQPIVCRYSPSCSVYAQQVLQKYGMMKGSFFAIRRLLSCQPWFHMRTGRT